MNMRSRSPRVLFTAWCLAASPVLAQMPGVVVGTDPAPVCLSADPLPELMSLGRILACRGSWVESQAKFREAVRLYPTNAEASLELGASLMMSGQTNEAAEYFSAARQLDPELAEKNERAARRLIEKNLLEAARRRLMLVWWLNPDSQFPGLPEGSRLIMICWLKPEDAGAHEKLGKFWWGQGRLEEALAEFKATLRLRPDAPSYNNLGLTLARQAKYAEAIQVYREAVRRYPQDATTLNNLAWYLAKNPRPELRNGREAVQLATQAVELSGRQQPVFFGTLAAAYAETGQFARAVEMAEKARALAVAAGQPELAAKNEQWARLYSAGKTTAATNEP